MGCRDRTTRRGAIGLRDGHFTVPLLAVLSIVGACLVRPVVAQDPLACGEPVAGFVSGEQVDVYRTTLAAGTVGFLQGSFVSGDGGDTLRIRVTGRGVDVETCSNVAFLDSQGGPLTIEVSPCFGGSGGDYLLNLAVISSSQDHCGFPLRCGATPDGIGLTELGEVDSFQLTGVAGGEIALRIDDADGREGAYLLRVFDPRGEQLTRVCSDQVTFSTTSAARYTVLVSACGGLTLGDYRLERFDETCPRGPVITTMAMLDRGAYVAPIDYDDFGRPVYESSGSGTVVVEGRVGASFRAVGEEALAIGSLPDFQAIVSRPLGDGNPAVCDQPERGGVAATTPFGFRGDPVSIERINDFGCRVDDGTGQAVGRRDPLTSCEDSSFFDFLDPTTDIQFCAQLPRAAAFPPGDTVLAARIRDLDGVLGAVREMIVRVPEATVPTVTPTPVPPTATPTRTRTPRPTTPPATRPPGPCTCDCNMSGRVRISELTRCVRIALGSLSIAECRAGDRDDDGNVAIGELVEGVNNALVGCPPKPVDDLLSAR